MLKVFAIEHTGIWPVGACSIVVAESKEEAIRMLEIEPLGIPDLVMGKVTEIDTAVPSVTCILNGDY